MRTLKPALYGAGFSVSREMYIENNLPVLMKRCGRVPYSLRSINEKDLHKKVKIWFASLRLANEKASLSRGGIWFISLRSINEKASLSRGFFRGIDEA